jgi:hypothetical protein
MRRIRALEPTGRPKVHLDHLRPPSRLDQAVFLHYGARGARRVLS